MKLNLNQKKFLKIEMIFVIGVGKKKKEKNLLKCNHVFCNDCLKVHIQLKSTTNFKDRKKSLEFKCINCDELISKLIVEKILNLV